MIKPLYTISHNGTFRVLKKKKNTITRFDFIPQEMKVRIYASLKKDDPERIKIMRVKWKI